MLLVHLAKESSIQIFTSRIGRKTQIPDSSPSFKVKILVVFLEEKYVDHFFQGNVCRLKEVPTQIDVITKDKEIDEKKTLQNDNLQLFTSSSFGLIAMKKNPFTKSSIETNSTIL